MMHQPGGGRGGLSGGGGGSRTPLLMHPDMLPWSRAMAEFMGALLFQLLAGSVASPAAIAAVYAGLMAAFARHSGGHLNPAVSLGATLSGHMAWGTAGLYIVAQLLGALAGAALQVWLTPSLGFGDWYAPACHGPMKDLGGTQLFLWETAAAFAFVYLLWPAMWTKPGYGAGGPLLAGVILFGVLSTAGQFTGFSPVNPALTLAGSIVFNCEWRYSWMYLLAQATGAGLAALLAVGVFGSGPMFLSEAERAHYSALSGGGEEATSFGGGRLEEGGGGGLTASPAGATGVGSAF